VILRMLVVFVVAVGLTAMGASHRLPVIADAQVSDATVAASPTVVTSTPASTVLPASTVAPMTAVPSAQVSPASSPISTPTRISAPSQIASSTPPVSTATPTPQNANGSFCFTYNNPGAAIADTVKRMGAAYYSVNLPGEEWALAVLTSISSLLSAIPSGPQICVPIPAAR